jgi:hypothetical protein
MTFDDANVYGFGRKPIYYTWRTPLEYHLFATSKQPEIVREPADPQANGSRQRSQHPRYEWSQSVPLLVRGMVLARDTLFIAGPPDVLDEEEAFRRFGSPEVEAQLAEQDALLAGKQGAQLWAVSAADGQKLAEHKLDTLPVFDGMAAARGRLFMATTDGRVFCFVPR